MRSAQQPRSYCLMIFVISICGVIALAIPAIAKESGTKTPNGTAPKAATVQEKDKPTKGAGKVKFNEFSITRKVDR